jgi:hypothetical protein
MVHCKIQKCFSKHFAETNGDAKLCPSIYTFRKKRPPKSLGRLFIVTGLVGSRCHDKLSDDL